MRPSKETGIKLTRYRYFYPPAWFPPDDEIAAQIARLCILREDLYIELQGVSAEKIEVEIELEGLKVNPDDNGDAYRRLYFMRASLRTLSEVRNAFFRLHTIRDFRQSYQQWESSLARKLKDYLKDLEKNLSELARIRDAMCGHVLVQSVQKALERMPTDEIGGYVQGETMKETHFGFAGTILAQILVQDIPKKDHPEHLRRIFFLNMKTTEVITDVFTWHLIRMDRLNPK